MTSRLTRVTMILALALLAGGAPTTAQSKDPFVGTWRLNIAKSTYSPGPAPKSQVSTYEAAGQGYKVSVKAETAAGADGAVVLHLQPGWQGVANHRQQPELRTRSP